jgi:hypothetical protein
VDWVAFWTAIAAIAAWFAVLGALASVLALALQLEEGRLDRQVDYYRKLTPFLSAEFDKASDQPSGNAPIVTIYADGGGFAFNVLATIIQTNSSTAQNSSLPGQEVLRYLRAGSSGRIAFNSPVGSIFAGYLTLTFIDTFGISHIARQSVNAATGQVATIDAINWTCGKACHVHVLRPSPSTGLLPGLARRLRFY